MSEQEAQQLFKKFMEDHGLSFVVYAVSPKTGTPIPVSEFLPSGWSAVAVKMVIKDGPSSTIPTT